MKVKIVGVVGSPRKNGNTRTLVEECLDGARELKDVETELVQLADYRIRGGCVSCFQCSREPGKLCHAYKDGFNEALERVLTGDGFIFGSPIYWGSLTAQMKMFIDRLWCIHHQVGCPLRNKPFGTVVSGAFRNGGQDAAVLDIIRAFMIADMIPIATTVNFPPEGMGGFWGVTGTYQGRSSSPEELAAKDGSQGDKAAMACSRNLGLRVAEMAKVIKAGYTLVNPENKETKWPVGILSEKDYPSPPEL